MALYHLDDLDGRILFINKIYIDLYIEDSGAKDLGFIGRTIFSYRTQG